MSGPRSASGRLAPALALLAALALGLSAGALLAEGAVLVPWWRSLPAGDFLGWYGSHASLLFGFFAPLEIGAAVLAVAAALVWRVQGRAGGRPLVAAALLAVAVLLAFPLYFRDVNAGFAAGTTPVETVPGELSRWAAWHAGRTLLAAGAFAAALLGLRGR